MTIKSGSRKDNMEYLDETVASKSKPKIKVKPMKVSIKPSDEPEEEEREKEKVEEEGNDELQLAEQIAQVYDLKERPEDIIEYLNFVEHFGGFSHI